MFLQKSTSSFTTAIIVSQNTDGWQSNWASSYLNIISGTPNQLRVRGTAPAIVRTFTNVQANNEHHLTYTQTQNNAVQLVVEQSANGTTWSTLLTANSSNGTNTQTFTPTASFLRVRYSASSSFQVSEVILTGVDETRVVNVTAGGFAKYRYGFNGMEKDDELSGQANSYDFGARMYNPRIARWMSRDPLEVKYAGLSPYNFVNNMPIIAIDPDGKRIIIVNGYYNTREIAKPLGASTSGKPYWSSNFEGEAQNFLGDFSGNTQWVDGNTIGALASGKENFNAGYSYAKENFAAMTEGMSEDEVINLVGHSMGAAFSAGIAQYIQEEGTYKVDNIVLLSAHDASSFSVPNNVNSYQIGYKGDPVVGEYLRAGNVKNFGVVNRSDLGVQFKHGTTKNGSVFNELRDLKSISFTKTDLTHTTYDPTGYTEITTSFWSEYKANGVAYGTDFDLVRKNVGAIFKTTNTFDSKANFYRPYAEPNSSETKDNGPD